MSNMNSQNAVDLHLILKCITMNNQNTANLHYDYTNSQNQNKLSTLRKAYTVYKAQLDFFPSDDLHSMHGVGNAYEFDYDN